MALIMSVYPGFGGQKYIDDVDLKITEIRNRMGEDFYIQVDGGIGIENIAKTVKNGANVIVAGSSVFKDNIEENVKALRNEAEQCVR
jgi:ribulose-phosphate 3-epimerase